MLRHTPLDGLHRALGARMAPFAGYDMPIQYKLGVMKEHEWTRTRAGLFDVSHMGQARLRDGAGPAASALETLVTQDIETLGPGRQRYALLMNEAGGVVDDLMVSRPDADGLFLIVNASRKAGDFALIGEKLSGQAHLEVLADRALLALQGPQARTVLAQIVPEAAQLTFMQAGRFAGPDGLDLLISCSGYTGEDGFEISVPGDKASAFAEHLLSFEAVEMIGLGARDSLRLEAGLCLYGHELDETVSPVEADLTWAVPKARRARASFAGADRVLRELAQGVARKRVGLKLLDRAPARDGALIQHAGRTIGVVTSGGFGPSVGGPIAMGFVPPELAIPGTQLDLIVRDQPRAAQIVKLPFHPHAYVRA